MSKIDVCIFLAGACVALLSSCGGPERYVKRGDAARAIGEYAEAAAQYKKAYSKYDPRERRERGAVAYSMAECYRRYGNTARALGAYRNALRYGVTDMLARFYEGEMLRYTGDYAGAERSYRAHLDSFPGDEAALRGIEACHDAEALKKKGSAYTIRLERLFNASRSDYAPALLGDEGDRLFFTTTRPQTTGDEVDLDIMVDD